MSNPVEFGYMSQRLIELTEEDIRAAIAYGAEMSRERYVDFLTEGWMKFKLDENFGTHMSIE